MDTPCALLTYRKHRFDCVGWLSGGGAGMAIAKKRRSHPRQESNLDSFAVYPLILLSTPTWPNVRTSSHIIVHLCNVIFKGHEHMKRSAWLPLHDTGALFQFFSFLLCLFVCLFLFMDRQCYSYSVWVFFSKILDSTLIKFFQGLLM
jgi:hypothetical protein